MFNISLSVVVLDKLQVHILVLSKKNKGVLIFPPVVLHTNTTVNLYFQCFSFQIQSLHKNESLVSHTRRSYESRIPLLKSSKMRSFCYISNIMWDCMYMDVYLKWSVKNTLFMSNLIISRQFERTYTGVIMILRIKGSEGLLLGNIFSIN